MLCTDAWDKYMKKNCQASTTTKMNWGQGARLTACNGTGGRGGVVGKKKENLETEDTLNLLLKITTVP